MRASLLLALPLLAGGCFDFGKLGKDFCQSSVAALCDDFESSTLDTRWQQRASGGAIDLTRPTSDGMNVTFAFRGKQALRLSASDKGEADVEESAVTPRYVDGAKTLSVRLFTLFEGALPADTVDLITLRDRTDAPVLTLSVVEGFPRLTEASSGRTVDDSARLLSNSWQCIELLLATDDLGTGSASHLTLNVDGGEDMSLSRLAPITGLGGTRIGLVRGMGPAATTTQLWLDEVIVDVWGGEKPPIPERRNGLVGCGE